MMTNQQKLVLAVGLLLFAAVKMAALFWWQNQPNSRPTATAQPENCDVLSGCVFSGSATLRLEGVGDNRTPFRVVATGLPENTRTVSASFAMPNMDMGFNRFDLKRQTDGSWLAEKVYLPLCSQSRRDWQITWTIDDAQQFQAAFRTKNQQSE